MGTSGKISITIKIQRAFLLVSVIALTASSVTTLISLFNIRQLTMNGHRNIGAAAADSSAASLLNQALGDITSLVQAKSDTIDRRLRQTVGNIGVLRGYIENIYARPEEFRPVKVQNFREVKPGETRLHWFSGSPLVPDPQYNEGDLVRAGLLEEIYALGNTERICRLLMQQDIDISTVYILTASGVNIQYDGDAAKKVRWSMPNFQERTWYTGPRDSGGLYVSGIYHDFAGRGMIASMSMPFYGKDGEFRGVAGVDIRTEELDESIRKTVVGETGYALLIDQNLGETNSETELVSAPGLDEANKSNIAAFLGTAAGSILEDMRVSPQGSAYSVLEAEGRDNSSIVVIWATVSLTGWRLVYVLSNADVIAPSEALRTDILGITGSIAERVNRLILLAIGISAGLLAVNILAALAVARPIAQRIARPITALSESIRKIGGGSLDYVSEIKTGDEIEELSKSFESMTAELRGYIAKVSRVTAERERISTELNVARKIQSSMLPKIFPAFPSRKEIDIYASMIPAREVGGDFYDFFFIDENTLAVLIADVSDKGVPAALFMVVAKTLIKNNIQAGKSPSEVFESVNNLLCENNGENMFVTAFMGCLDIPTGTFTFANAGHNLPLLERNGGIEWLNARRGLVLAGMEGSRYPQGEMVLEPGCMVYLYTDGVTEARNPQKELFGDERLLEAAVKYRRQTPEEFALSIKQEIDRFAAGAEQADDITMLVLRYQGGSGPHTVSDARYI